MNSFKLAVGERSHPRQGFALFLTLGPLLLAGNMAAQAPKVRPNDDLHQLNDSV